VVTTSFPRAARRLFAVYATASLVPVLLLGGLLVRTGAAQSDARGLAQARDQAALFADAVVGPVLTGHALDSGLSKAEEEALRHSTTAVVSDGTVLRLRLRGTAGLVVFASDGSGGGLSPDEAAMEAAHGVPVTELTTFDGDVAHGRGKRVVEAYQPLRSTRTGRLVGVLEIYLPYDGIASEITADRRQQTVVLAGGLAALWLVLLLISTSVTRRLRREAVLNGYLASHDALTGLPNRSQFALRAAEAVAAATPEAPAAIALIDLDRFKQVNDTLGHPIGDRLLRILADRLSAAVGKHDLVARLGGDEFGLVLPDVEDAAAVERPLTQLRAVLAEQLLVDDLPLSVEASIGFVLAPQDGEGVDTLLTKVDVAMYVAKRRHLGVVQHAPEHPHLDPLTLRLVGELGRAIDRDELVLHYQPKTDLRAKRVTAVEALVRWEHPERGLLYPDEFLPAAEQTELIEPLTRWVLHEATRALAQMDPSGELSMAVNISARSLARADFADEVMAVLASTGTDPTRVLLEITETALLTEPDRAASTLGRLAAYGVRVSIDDFGAGQTSLGYLASLPVTELKIDRAFVSAMDTNPRNAAIVRSVIELGHNLDFVVTAEGVETAAVLEQLHAAHCDLVQGYLLGRPVPSADLRLGTPVTP
jgi:diguanylate cyclase (GGDEF)-like protein